MHNKYNPFKANRTEQMNDLWKYYVPFPGLDGSPKPIVVEGGRGSGKTMFFQCNSWRQILAKIKKNGEDKKVLFDEYDFVGIYYRVDTTFVSSMCNEETTDWEAIFETYLGICILQEILDLILTVSDEMNIDEQEKKNFAIEFSKRLYSDSKVDNLEDFRCETNRYLDSIEDKINGVNEIKIRLIKARRFINDVCKSCGIILKREILFKIFIDEYETLKDCQQKIVNTLIKHSELPVIFNIGLRPHGMRTNEAISKTETIEAPHDYEMLTLGIENPESYPDILMEICRKRIALGKEQGKIPTTAPDDIKEYLGDYSIEYEIESMNTYSLKYLNKLSSKIEELGSQEGLSVPEIKKYIDSLCDQAPILNSRLHYALICRKTKYTPTLSELYNAYNSKSQRYNDWMHNRKFGLIFLLCKEAKKEKMYYGFDVYVALSSNIVRYFLELCEQAFRIAFLSGYEWKSSITPEIQTEAARYVSEYKVLDVIGYEPFGRELRIFIQYLGQIFYRLHTDENSTLGEPEPNHFNTKDLSLTDTTKHIISSAVMWNVLQEGEPTKRKQSKCSPETVDYYINKIYAPYFGISYRNQRKILLQVEVLNKLLSGNEVEARSGIGIFFKSNKNQEETTHQKTLFDCGNGDCL